MVPVLIYYEVLGVGNVVKVPLLIADLPELADMYQDRIYFFSEEVLSFLGF